MAKKIEFILDVNKKPIDVAIDASLNLKQAFRELNKELARTKEGTPEFEVLSKKMGDVKDQIDKTNAKSRDLFSSLSLLPGPVGAFAGQVDGAIGTLKTFTSFSFKDLKFQLGETINDFKDIAGNIGKATGITKIYTVINNALASSFVKVGVGEAAAATGARAFAAALTATGIGAIVVALGLAVSALMDWADTSDEAEQATKEFNDELARQNELFELNQAASKRANNLIIAQMKAAGKSQKEIRDEQLRQSYKSYEDAFAQEKEARDLYNKSVGKVDGEALKALGDNLTKREQASKQAYNDYLVLGYTFEADALEQRKAAGQKEQQQQQQKNEKLTQNTKDLYKKLKELRDENTATSITDERKRQDQELANAKQKEKDDINALELKDTKINGVVVKAEELRKQMLEQIDLKYKNKADDLTTKRNKEDLDKKQEILDLMEELSISSIKDEGQKAIALDQQKYDKQKAKLDKALADKVISQDQYNQAIKNLDEQSENERTKITTNEENKRKEKRDKAAQDEIDALKNKGELLRQGTKAYYDYREQLLNKLEQQEIDRLDRELLGEEEYQKKKTEIQEKYAKQRQDNRTQENNERLRQVGQIINELGQVANALASAYEDEAKTSKEAFEKRKKLQIASAVMSAAAAIINILAAPVQGSVVLDAILKGARILTVGIQTGVQIDKIKKTQFEGGGGAKTTGPRNYARGGMINGPRHAQGGTLIEAEGGEAVMTRGAVTMFRPLLSAMNEMGGGTSFNSNLMSRPDIADVSTPSESQAAPIFRTYVVSNDLTTEQEKQARLKDLSTL